MYKTISEMVSQGMVLRVSIYKVHFKVLTGTYFTILNRMYKRNLVVFLSFFYKLTQSIIIQYSCLKTFLTVSYIALVKLKSIAIAVYCFF